MFKQTEPPLACPFGSGAGSLESYETFVGFDKPVKLDVDHRQEVLALADSTTGR